MSNRSRVIEALRTMRNPKALVVLEGDKRLQKILASWEFIDFKVGPDIEEPKDLGDMSSKDLVVLAWESAEVNTEQLHKMTGGGAKDEIDVERAKQLGLGYPDGTVHEQAEQWLLLRTQRIIRGPGK